jgi:hypothetical protein
VLQRCFTQEPLTALAASPNGCYLVGGGSSGTLYCWETASGKLLRSWPAHYKVRAANSYIAFLAVHLPGEFGFCTACWCQLQARHMAHTECTVFHIAFVCWLVTCWGAAAAAHSTAGRQLLCSCCAAGQHTTRCVLQKIASACMAGHLPGAVYICCYCTACRFQLHARHVAHTECASHGKLLCSWSAHYKVCTCQAAWCCFAVDAASPLHDDWASCCGWHVHGSVPCCLYVVSLQAVRLSQSVGASKLRHTGCCLLVPMYRITPCLLRCCLCVRRVSAAWRLLILAPFVVSAVQHT